MDCTRKVGPSEAEQLGEILRDVAAGAVVCLEPGTYPLNALVKRSLTLRGLGASPDDVILDGTGRSSVLRVAGGESTSVVLERLTVTGGSTPNEGAGVESSTEGELVLRDVVLRGNRADGGGGGGLAAHDGRVLVERCRVVGNRGKAGGAIRINGAARAVLRQTLVADNDGTGSILWVREAAELVLEHVTIAGNRAGAALEISGTMAAAPTVRVVDSIVAGTKAIQNGPTFPGEVTVTRTILHGETTGISDGGGNRTEDPQLETTGIEPFRPKKTSPAVGIAQPGLGQDLTGTPTGTTAGALQPLH